MPEKKMISQILIGAGVLVGAASILADTIGFGADPSQFGRNQIIGTVAGVIILIVGLGLYFFGGKLPGASE